MAKLDLPFRAYVEDFASRAFPNRTFARGTAANDLVIKASAAILQPLRHEIDALKVNQSMANYRFMSDADMDGLAANWGAFRKTGGVATGTVRLFFDTIADYQLNYLQFLSDDGVTFQLQAPVTIPATALLQNQSTGSIPTYSFDITVVSVGIGSRYSVAAGTISRAINPPANLVRCTNPEAFEVTEPNETNYDLLNRLYRDLGLKNRVSRASIRSPIFDQFPGVLDVLVAGATHPKMLRDLLEVKLPDNTVTTLHLGGKADVWLNTINATTFVQAFGYLPSSGRIRLVSALQAAAQDATYSFSRALLTVDSTFAATDPLIEPDESMALQALQAGVPVSATVVSGKAANGMTRVAGSDLTRGEGAFGLSSGSGLTPYPAHVLFDPENNFADIGAQPGDMLYISDNQYAAVSRVSPNVLELCPGSIAIPVSVSSSVPHPRGAFALTLTTAPVLPQTPAAVDAAVSRLLVATGEAQGYYRVLATLTPTTYKIGTPISECTLASGVFVEAATGGDIYDFTVTAGTVPLDANSACAIYRSAAHAVAAAAANAIFPIQAITRDAATVIRAFVPTGSTTTSSSVTLVQGLRGVLASTDTVTFETDQDATPLRGDARTFTQWFTRYANVLDADLDTIIRPIVSVTPAALQVLITLGATHAYQPGQLISVVATDTTGWANTGWSGIVRIISVPSPTTIEVLYDTIPSGTFTSAWVVRNVIEAPGAGLAAVAGDALLIDTTGATFVPGTTPGGDGPYASLPVMPFPYGSTALAARRRNWLLFGGGVQGVFPVGTPYAVQASQASPVASVAATVLSDYTAGVGTMTFAAPLGSGLGDGTGFILTTSAGEVCVATASSASGSRTLTFQPGKVAQVLTFTSGQYTGASAAQIGQTVVQADGLSTVSGILVEVDNTLRTWTVTLTNPGSPFVPSGGNVNLASGTAGGHVASVAAFANGPAGDTNKFGYWPPAGGDVGQLVRQGTYTGILTGFTSTTWLVHPNSDADLFDSTTAPTFIDNGAYLGFPVVTGNARKSCVLATPASAPSLAGSAPVLRLDRPLSTPGALTVAFRPRYPSTGGLLTASQLRISGQAFAVSEFANVQPSAGTSNPTGLVINAGTNLGGFDIQAAGASALDLTSPVTTEVSRILNAGAATTTSGITAAAGATSITLPGTTWGFWACAGRVLVLSVAGVTYYLEASGPGATNADINLLTPLPITINSGQQVTAEVVDGFITPFMLPNRALAVSYRLVRPSKIANEVYPLGGALAQLGGATTVATSTFEGGNVDYRSTLQDAGTEGLYLHLDSGPEASPEPLKITAFTGTSTFTVDHVFEETAVNVAYHISHRQTRQAAEAWVVAKIDGAGRLELVDAVPTALLTSASTTGRVQAVVQESVFFADNPGVVTAISGQFVTLSTSAALAGFAGLMTRVSFRLDDRAQASAVTGSLLATYDYYAGGYMTLPLVRVQKVEVLDAANGQAVATVPFVLEVNDPGTRYSHVEDVSLYIADPTAVYQPLRVTYTADPSIEAVDNFLNDFNTRVENANQMAKRMETLLINVSLTVRSTSSAAALSSQLAQYINTRPSTQTMSKDGMIQFLYQNNLVTGVRTDLFVLTGTYYQLDGTEVVFADTAEIFGADTACYVAGTVNVVVE